MKKSITIFEFFKRKTSNDLEVNTSDTTLSTTNIEENLDIPIEENPDEPVKENLDVPIEKNLNIPIEQNSTI